MKRHRFRGEPHAKATGKKKGGWGKTHEMPLKNRLPACGLYSLHSKFTRVLFPLRFCPTTAYTRLGSNWGVGEGGGRWSRGISRGTFMGMGRVGLRGGFGILTNGACFIFSF